MIYNNKNTEGTSTYHVPAVCCGKNEVFFHRDKKEKAVHNISTAENGWAVWLLGAYQNFENKNDFYLRKTEVQNTHGSYFRC